MSVGRSSSELAHAGSAHLLVVRDDLAAAAELPLDRGLLAHEQDRDAEDGATEPLAGGRAPVGGAQLHDLVVQQLDGLGLDPRAWEPVDDDAGLIFRFEQLAQQRLDHLAIARRTGRDLSARASRACPAGRSPRWVARSGRARAG